MKNSTRIVKCLSLMMALVLTLVMLAGVMSSCDESWTIQITPNKTTEDSTNEPDTEEPEPDTDKPEPDTDKPEPDTEEPEPDTDEPEPDTDEPEPDTDKPEPDTDKPEPDTDEPEPDTDKPEPDITHSLKYVRAKAATCTEEGNIAYYVCSECNKMYMDADAKVEVEDISEAKLAHKEVVDEAVAPTAEKAGLTEGSHCEVCGEVIVEQHEVPKLEEKLHSVTYRNSTDKFALPKIATEFMSYKEGKGIIDLPKPTVNGYEFKGWYTKSTGGELIDNIPSDSKQDLILYAHWEAVKYTVTYEDAPVHSNPVTYTIEDEIKLTDPEWSGLAFTHWTDAEGETVEKIQKGTTGNLEFKANWKRMQNIATKSTNEQEQIVAYDEESGIYCFIYEIGTIEHVVLENITIGGSNLKYNSGAGDLAFELTNTVSIEDGVANTIAKTVSESVSQSGEWSKTQEWSKSRSTTHSLNIEFPIKCVKFKLGASTTTGSTWGESSTEGGSTTSGSEQENSASSTVSYKKEITDSVVTKLTISKDMPEGYYSYVHAGNLRLYAVVLYDPINKNFDLHTYSVLDNMHELMLYYRDSNELNSRSTEALAYDVPTEKIEAYLENALYTVKYDANGGKGSMSESVFSNSIDEMYLIPNKYTRDGYTFAGWSKTKTAKTAEYSDKALFNGKSQASGSTVTLYAVWTPDTYKVTYDLNAAKGGPNGTAVKKQPTASKAEENVVFGAKKTLTVPTCKYYVFDGWYTAASGGQKITGSDGKMLANWNMAKNVTLYAHWKQQYNGIYIATPEEFAKIGRDEDYPLSGYYYIVDYILLGESIEDQWTPIGTYIWDHSQKNDFDNISEPFTGTIDGLGHWIKYYTTVNVGNEPNKDAAWGLIGTAKDATFKNIDILSHIMKGDGSTHVRECAMGGLVGMAQNVTITNCRALPGNDVINKGLEVGHDYNVRGAFYAGGLVGDARNCTIKKCENHSVVEAGAVYAYAGGIAGNSYETTIENCMNCVGNADCYHQVEYGYCARVKANNLSWSDFIIGKEYKFDDIYGKNTAPWVKLNGNDLLTKEK